MMKPCFVIECDGCGAEPEGELGGLHFLVVEEARRLIAEYGWVEEGDEVLCEECQRDAARGEADHE